jgi:methylenetetrahydrofolate dehydrogenase (NADP+)/methenyltetrahydrofolate cyclohydrolase
MRKIDGSDISRRIIGGLKELPVPAKFLAVFLVGEDSVSLSFIRQKKELAEELGIDFRLYQFPSEIKNDEVRERIRKIVSSKTCGGAVIQLPLPEQLNPYYVLNAILREKDIDVLAERSVGAFYANRSPILPPAVGTVEEILRETGTEIEDARVAVVGPGMLVGKPVSLWLMGRAGEIIVIDKGGDLEKVGEADLVILGVGRPGLVDASLLKEGVGVIDFGYRIEGGKIKGDFDAEKSSPEKLKFYTPTPNGTGPILVAKLLENFYRLNNR